MTKRNITYLLLSIALTAYMVIALSLSHNMADAAPCKGIDIVVHNQSASPFVTSEDINIELGDLRSRADSVKASEIDLAMIEDKLNALPNIERANCLRTNNNLIAIEVYPMEPVARVFDDTVSYYLNRQGKRLTANARYRVDLLIISCRFDAVVTPMPVLLLIEQIENNPKWKSLVTAYHITRGNDILLIPSVTGHVINFGDAANADSKFQRLSSFYAQVMPVKGWNYYDTISVKFSGQVVAQIAPDKRNKVAKVEYTDEDFDEIIHPMEETPGGVNEDHSTAIPTIQ